MTSPLLKLVGVGRSFPSGKRSSVQALSDIDLEIEAGEFVAIVGPSGGGKSSLLAILGLLDEQTVGSYEILGVSTNRGSDVGRTRLRSTTMAFVFQAFHLLEKRQVLDSVELGLLYQGVHPKERREKSARMLSALGLQSKASIKSADLSGGQQQRVAIARAMVSDTPVLLADEPTGNLDSVSGAAVLDELERAHRQGATVIVVTHSAEVANRAERVVSLIDGRVISDVRHRSTLDRPPKIPQIPSRSAGARVSDVFRDAIASVVSRAGQSVALISAVAIAVAMMIVSLGLGTSARAQVSDSFDSRANREVSVIWQGSGVPPSLEASSEAVSGLAGVESVAALSDHGEATVSTRGASLSVALRGVAGDLQAATLSSVTWVNASEASVGEGEAVIGRALARQLFLAPLSLSPSVVVAGRTLTVVGILEESRRYPLLVGQVIASEGTAYETKEPSKVEVAIVTTAGSAPQVGRYAAIAIDPARTEQYVTNVPLDPNSLRLDVEGGVQTALAAFTVLTAVVALFALANAITLSVVARTGEFGLRRAVGARPRDLGALVSIEAALIGIAGGIAGLVVGILALLGFTISQQWVPVFDFRLAPLSVAAGLLLAVLSSVLGASKAARVLPAQALRS